MDNNNKIEVTFTHPTNPNTFTAFISPQCTGQRAIQGLLLGNDNGPFLDALPAGQTYELALKRTGEAITPNTTFVEAGIISGDVIEVGKSMRGASR